MYKPEFMIKKIIPKDAKALESAQCVIWIGRFLSLLSTDKRLL